MTSVTGTYEHTIDSKGRLFIPAKLRDALGPVCYLTMGIDDCLAIYPQESWDRFTEKFSALPMSQSRKMRPLFANAVMCEPDKQGRILLPQRLCRYAGLQRDVAIIGVHNRLEIWDRDRWYAGEEEMTPEKMAEILADVEM